MGVFQQMIVVGLLFTAASFTAVQRLQIATPNAPFPARQIAYNMRLFHQAAIAFKIANPSDTATAADPLPVPVPSFLTEWRVAACADPKNVATYTVGLTAAQNRDIVSELLRQSVSPPELGIISASPAVTGYLGSVTPQAAYDPGIGLSEPAPAEAGGTVVNTGYGAVTPACSIPAGASVMQTQVMP